MAIEAHKCNQPGCKGFVVFENADFDLNDITVDEKYGCYAFDRPHCSECGKEFLVIPHYIVIDVKDKDLGDFEQLESACMTAFEKRQQERKYEAEGTCCDKPNRQTFGPNDVFQTPTTVCMNCGRLYDEKGNPKDVSIGPPPRKPVG